MTDELKARLEAFLSGDSFDQAFAGLELAEADGGKVRARLPVGRRLLWGNAAAATAGAFAALSAAELPSADRAAQMLQDARRLLQEPGSPIEGLADLFPVDHDGAVRLFVRRHTCCLRYRLPDAPRTCLSCRLLPEAERRRRITLKLAS